MKPSTRLVVPSFDLPYIAPEDFILRSEFQKFDDRAVEFLSTVEKFPQSDRTRVSRISVLRGVGPVRPTWVKTVE